jgi:hypothetical protein
MLHACRRCHCAAVRDRAVSVHAIGSPVRFCPHQTLHILRRYGLKYDLFTYLCARPWHTSGGQWQTTDKASGFGGLGVCMLASGTEDRGFAPDRSRRNFPDGKIHSIPSFGRRSKIICPMLVTRTTKKVKKVKTVKTVNYGTKKPGRSLRNFRAK